MKSISVEEVEERLIQLADRLSEDLDEKALAAASLQHRVLSTILTIKLKVRVFGSEPDDAPANGRGEHPIVDRLRRKGVDP